MKRYFVSSLVVFILVVLVICLIQTIINANDIHTKTLNSCQAKCGISRIKIINEKCHCRQPWGWMVPGTTLKINIKRPRGISY